MKEFRNSSRIKFSLKDLALRWSPESNLITPKRRVKQLTRSQTPTIISLMPRLRYLMNKSFSKERPKLLMTSPTPLLNKLISKWIMKTLRRHLSTTTDFKCLIKWSPAQWSCSSPKTPKRTHLWSKLKNPSTTSHNHLKSTTSKISDVETSLPLQELELEFPHGPRSWAKPT